MIPEIASILIAKGISMNDKAKELLDDFKSKVKELNEPSFWSFFLLAMYK